MNTLRISTAYAIHLAVLAATLVVVCLPYYYLYAFIGYLNAEGSPWYLTGALCLWLLLYPAKWFWACIGVALEVFYARYTPPWAVHA